ncbi:MAG: oligosaccharide flippase family protein, partial [Candidatus Micrarchaeaceae archaeon]
MEQVGLNEGRDTTLKGAYWQYVSSIFTVAVGALFYIFIIHVYTTEIVGVFALLSAVATIFSAIFSLGLQTGTQHFISYHLGRGEDGAIKSLIRKMIFFSLILSFSSFATVWLLSPLLSSFFFHTFKYIHYLRLIDIEISLMIVTNLLLSMLLGLQNFKTNGLMLIVNSGIGYGLIAPIFLLYRDPIGILYAWITGYSVSFTILLAIISMKMRSVKAEEERIRPVLVYSFPIFLSSLIGTGSVYVDRFIVSFFLNLSELGIYNFSLLIINAMSILTIPFSTILLSKLSEFYGRGDRESFRLYSEKAVEMISAVYVPIALLLAALSQSVLLFLANSRYLPGTVP